MTCVVLLQVPVDLTGANVPPPASRKTSGRRLSFRSNRAPRHAPSPGGGGKAKRHVDRSGVSTRALADVWDEKDRVGVRDTVMLDDFRSEGAFIKNLEVRFQKDLIYVR